jgi:oligopeptidase A
MAGSPTQALEFLEDLARRTKPFAERDMESCANRARRAQSRRRPRLRRELREREAAPEALLVLRRGSEASTSARSRCSRACFRVVETIYGVRIHAAACRDVGIRAVRFYEITDGRARASAASTSTFTRATRSAAARGWPRRSAAAGSAAACRRPSRPHLQLLGAGGRKPALFRHGEVNTLFHEFGHGLHHLLTQVDELGVAGINGVEFDAVELPSQFMENFCWSWQVIEPMTRHVDTGARMPRALFERMVAAKNFQSGLNFVRQLEFALFDMRLHHEFAPSGDILSLLDDVRARVAVVKPPAYKPLSAPIRAHLRRRLWGGLLQLQVGRGPVGRRLRRVRGKRRSRCRDRSALPPRGAGRGGSRPALESFVAFRGRKPQIDALLRHNGMTANA